MKKRLLFIAAIAALSGCLEHPPDQGATTQSAEKVVICHVPPDDPSNAHEIEVSTAAANAHIVGHGDTLGPCSSTCRDEGYACTSDSQCCLGACIGGVCDSLCAPGSTVECYEVADTSFHDVGTCVGGLATCNQFGTAYGDCDGDVAPTTEVCGDALDNDCDGSVDDGCITGHVWNDTEGTFMQGTTSCDFGPTNGLQEGDEPSVAGAGLSLLSLPTNTVVGTTTSNSNGDYSFSNVVGPGSYRIVLTLMPSGVNNIVGPNQGTDDTVDSDFMSDEETGTFVDFSYSGAPLDFDLGLRNSCGT